MSVSLLTTMCVDFNNMLDYTASLLTYTHTHTHTGVDLVGALPRKPRKLSLLELMQSPSWDNSAESTAQKLLRYMTGHMTGIELDDTQVVCDVCVCVYCVYCV